VLDLAGAYRRIRAVFGYDRRTVAEGRKYPHPMPKEGIAASVSELAADTSRLVQLEIEMLKQEIGELVKRNAIAIGMLVGSAMAALFFFIFLQVWFVARFGHWVAVGLTVFWLLAAVALAMVGKARIKFAGPENSIKSIKEDLEWAIRQIRPETK
jgi:hypothetical protein